MMRISAPPRPLAAKADRLLSPLSRGRPVPRGSDMSLAGMANAGWRARGMPSEGARALSAERPSGSDDKREKDHGDHDKEEEQHLRDPGSGCRDAGEAEQRRDQRDHQEEKGPAQH